MVLVDSIWSGIFKNWGVQTFQEEEAHDAADRDDSNNKTGICYVSSVHYAKPFIYILSFNPDKNSMRIIDEETELQRNNLH